MNFPPFQNSSPAGFPCFVVGAVQCEIPHRLVQGRRTDPCRFQIAWQINPYMKIGTVDESRAIAEHSQFIETLRREGASVVEVPFVHGQHDSVFVKDNALLVDNSDGVQVFVARPRCIERSEEQAIRIQDYKKLGFRVSNQTQTLFEGGDFIFLPDRKLGLMGYGFRSEKKAAVELSEFTQGEVVPLELVDPHFYHLDMALATMGRGNDQFIFYYPEAFSPGALHSLGLLKTQFTLVPVSRQSALDFGLNWVEIDNTVVVGKAVSEITSLLTALGKRVVVSPLLEFQKAGGSAACLTSRIYRFPTSQPNPQMTRQTIMGKIAHAKIAQ